ncbi:MAG: YebC/PmpR family DNA-binding transcriptional regulator [Bacilli bacterium]
MSGHSKWATIHRKKDLLDQARGKMFQKIAKEIYVAARGTDGDPSTNASLRMVLEKAKGANMPKDNIQKAIDKATKSAGTEEFETIRYEGYGPSGVAVMVDCLTDNRNRTASLVRSTFTKRGGNLGTDGSVSYMFKRRGIIVTSKELSEDEMMMLSLDAGAEDFLVHDDEYEIYTKTEDLLKVKENLENKGIKNFLKSEVTFTPDNKMQVDEEAMEKVYGLVDELEDLDDVQDVFHNLDD